MHFLPAMRVFYMRNSSSFIELTAQHSALHVVSETTPCTTHTHGFTNSHTHSHTIVHVPAQSLTDNLKVCQQQMMLLLLLNIMWHRTLCSPARNGPEMQVPLPPCDIIYLAGDEQAQQR